MTIYRGHNAIILKQGIEIGIAKDIRIEIDQRSEVYFEAGQLTGTKIKEGPINISGRISKAWINVNYLDLLEENPLSDFTLCFRTQTCGPALYCYNCKFFKLNLPIPQDGFLMEDYNFKAKTLGAIQVPCYPGPGSKAILIMGPDTSMARFPVWSLTKLLETLGFDVTRIPATDSVPDLTNYSSLWMTQIYTHGVYSEAELNRIQDFVEVQKKGLIVLGDVDSSYTMDPINQLAGIWGNAYRDETIGNYYVERLQTSHALWTDPIKILNSLQNDSRSDCLFDTVDPTFTKYLSASGIDRWGIFRIFDATGKSRMIFSGVDAVWDHDAVIVNHVKWLDDVKTPIFEDDFANLDAWTLDKQDAHKIEIIDGKLHWSPIADGGNLDESSLTKTLASPLSGNFLLVFDLKWYEDANSSMQDVYVELLDIEDNVVCQFYVKDHWGGHALHQFLYSYCDSDGVNVVDETALSATHLFSMHRQDDKVYFCHTRSTVIMPDGGIRVWNDVGECTRSVAKIRIRFAHYTTYWNSGDYIEIDKIILF